MPSDNIREVEQLEDGTSVYEYGDLPLEAKQENNFYSNLATDFPESGLKKLSAFLLDAIDEDIEARRDWMDSVEKVEQYLGFSLEDLTNVPFKESTRTFDTTLSTALIRFYATTRAELLPASGPAGFQINGNDDDLSNEKGEIVRNYINYCLTIKDKTYYPDFERFILYLGIYGSMFKKVYYDTFLKYPVARFILPKDFIIDSDCTSILESNRLTHILHLSKRDILYNQQNDIYRDIELPYLKNLEINTDDNPATSVNQQINLEAYTKRSLFPIYEVHTYLNLEEFSGDDTNDNIPLPYIVIIDKTSKEILSIRNNWKQDDPDKKRNNYFVQYNYLPGFGIHGVGLAHLLGSNAITSTRLLRQLVDAGTFQNLPAGFRVKGMKEQNNDMVLGPGEWKPLDTGSTPLKEAFANLPYPGPSLVLKDLLDRITNQCKELGSTAELGMLSSKEDIPTGTAYAFLEVQNRISSAVLKSIHNSFAHELQLLAKLFKDTIGFEKFYFSGKEHKISKEDFIEGLEIIPVSDPSMNSTIQRIMRAESVLAIAGQNPQMHNMHSVLEMVYSAQGLNPEQIKNILLPEPNSEDIIPLDPVSENLNIKNGQPAKAAIWQAHDAHKLVHGLFAEQNPDLKPTILAHIREHENYEYLIEIQQLLGINLPSLEQLQDPQIQNEIAMNTASRLEELQNNMPQQPAPIDSNAIMMADIQQKEQETIIKEKIANQKTETDVFKTQLDFEKEKAKIESNEKIAQLKSETELLKNGIATDSIDFSPTDINQ